MQINAFSRVLGVNTSSSCKGSMFSLKVLTCSCNGYITLLVCLVLCICISGPTPTLSESTLTEVILEEPCPASPFSWADTESWELIPVVVPLQPFNFSIVVWHFLHISSLQFFCLNLARSKSDICAFDMSYSASLNIIQDLLLRLSAWQQVQMQLLFFVFFNVSNPQCSPYETPSFFLGLDVSFPSQL